MKVLVRIYGIPYRGKHVMPLELSEYIGQYVVLQGDVIYNRQGRLFVKWRLLHRTLVFFLCLFDFQDHFFHADSSFLVQIRKKFLIINNSLFAEKKQQRPRQMFRCHCLSGKSFSQHIHVIHFQGPFQF